LKWITIQGAVCVTLICLWTVTLGQTKTHVAMRHVEDYGGKGSGAGEFLDPSDVSIDPSGNFLVSDTGNHRLVKLNQKGGYLSEVGGFGWDDGQFNEPVGVSAGSGLELFVADGQNQRIAVYSQHLKLVAVVGGRDTEGSLSMGRLGGVASTREGEVYATDVDFDQVIQISTFSRTDRSFGGYGYGAGELRMPSALVVDDEGRVYVCDTGNDRIVVFDRFGNYDREIGADVLGKPEGVAIGKDDVLYVSDTESNRIVAFDLNTNGVVGKLGGPKRGGRSGQFDTPKGLAFGHGDHLFVADAGNHRVAKFKTLVLRRKMRGGNGK